MGTVLAGLVGVIVGVLGTEGTHWFLNQIRRAESFTITSATVEHVPTSAPEVTILVVALDSSNTKATPKITSIAMVDANRLSVADYTFTGADAAKIRDGKVVLANLGNETVMVEVLHQGRSGIYDLDDLLVEVRASDSACKTSPIRRSGPTPRA